MKIIIHKKNQGDTIQFITTEDFAIKHKGKLISKSMVNQIYSHPAPLQKITSSSHALRPKISEEIPGEELKMKANISPMVQTPKKMVCLMLSLPALTECPLIK